MPALILTDLIQEPVVTQSTNTADILNTVCWLLLGSLLVVRVLVWFKLLNTKLIKYWSLVAILVLLLSVYLNYSSEPAPVNPHEGKLYYRGQYFSKEEYDKRVHEDDSLYRIRQIEDSLNLLKSKSDSMPKNG